MVVDGDHRCHDKPAQRRRESCTSRREPTRDAGAIGGFDRAAHREYGRRLLRVRPAGWRSIFAAPQSVWLGTRKSGSVWQTTFAEPTHIGSILQINSDDPQQLKNAPRNYSWQVSDDGEQWTILHETVVLQEYRLFRIHRLKQAVTTKHIRLVVNLSHGSAPALREVEFYSKVDAEIPCPEWIVAVSSDEDSDNVSLGMPFVSLARLCEGWEYVPHSR